MSDLHVGLLILGFLIVGYVVIYNWWQDRKLQKRANQAFSKPNYDSLLEPEQTELFNKDYKELETENLDEDPLREINDNESNDLKKETTYEETSNVNFSDLDISEIEAFSPIDFISEVRSATKEKLITSDYLNPYFNGFKKNISFYVRSSDKGLWELTVQPFSTRGSVRVGLQLIDSNGTISMNELTNFSDQTKLAANNLGGISASGAISKAFRNSENLNTLKIETGFVIGINLQASPDHLFSRARINLVAEDHGLELKDDGTYIFKNEDNDVLFTMIAEGNSRNKSESSPNTIIQNLNFVMDVPMVTNGIRGFDTLVEVARHFSRKFDLPIIDDAGVLISDLGIEKIRSKLVAVYSKMDQAGISAGSDAVKRIFGK